MEQATINPTVEEADMAPEMESAPASAPAAAPGPERVQDPGVTAEVARQALDAAETELRGIFGRVAEFDAETAAVRSNLEDLQAEASEARAAMVLNEQEGAAAELKALEKRLVAAKAELAERTATRAALARRWRHAAMAARECTATLHRAVAFEAEESLAETHRQIAEAETALEAGRHRAACLEAKSKDAVSRLKGLDEDEVDAAVGMLRGSPSEIRTAVADNPHVTIDRFALDALLCRLEAGRATGPERGHAVVFANLLALFYDVSTGAILGEPMVLREGSGNPAGYQGATPSGYLFNPRKVREMKLALLRQRDAGVV